MKRSTLITLLIILAVAGSGFVWHFRQNHLRPAQISDSVNLLEPLRFTGPVSLRPRAYTGDLDPPPGVFGTALAGYTFRDATRTYYRYDVFLYLQGGGRGPNFEEQAAKILPPEESTGSQKILPGWQLVRNRRICVLPISDEPSKYAAGNRLVRHALWFEHRTLPVEVVVIQTVVSNPNDTPVGHQVSLSDASPAARLPVPAILFHESADAFESIVEK